MEPLKGKKVNLYLDEALWQDFRVACIRRKISASHAVGKYMSEQLGRWGTAPEGNRAGAHAMAAATPES